ncbi:MmgE/PrpD family protein [Amycolatopsis jejuensis]|uniref:MmgE/PrpD family protein n=1 Tax=Amycolatopsis jejuensis TaxID=330084 RepID=UPI00068E2684|nr:MmgE/PrpD family protein [Amycolatopsis jejuensis]
MSESLASFIASFDGSRLSDEVLGKATTGVIDGLSVIVAGAAEETSAAVHRALARTGQLEGESTILGTRHKAGMLDAALCNGVAAHAHDFDDVLQGHTTHPTTHLLPVLLAIAEQQKVTGRDFLEAYVVGLEAELGLAIAMGRAHYRAGWHSTGTLGTVGAVASACRLLRLDERHTRHALGIGCSSAAGLRIASGSMVKPLHAGHAARIGVEAAVLAAEGFTGPSEPFTGRFGYYQAFSAELNDTVPRWETDEGRRGTAVNRLSFKPYPCCGEATAAVQAAIIIREEINAADIERITVKVCPLGREVLPFDLPRTPDEARFSAPYCVGAAFHQGQLGLEDFTHEAVGREQIADLAKRTSVEVDPDLPDPGAEVQVWATDGRHATRRIVVPEGNYQIGLRREVAVAKFAACTAHLMGAGEAKRHFAELEHLRDGTNVSAVIRALVPQD